VALVALIAFLVAQLGRLDGGVAERILAPGYCLELACSHRGYSHGSAVMAGV